MYECGGVLGGVQAVLAAVAALVGLGLYCLSPVAHQIAGSDSISVATAVAECCASPRTPRY